MTQSDLDLAYSVSRFRFWFYLTGPFTVGCIYGASRYLDLLNLRFFVYLFYFLVPANVFLYGVNDYWDMETDLLNPKKDEKEHRVGLEEKKRLTRILQAVALFSLFLVPFMQSMGERLIFTFFLFLSHQYSAKPLRFKERPILDSASNVLYIMPGVFAYYWVTGHLPPGVILLAGFLHTYAMHLFSAIPDIEYDKETGITSTAVLLGRNASLILCLLAWSGLSAITIIVGGVSPFRFLPLVYPLMVLNLLIRDQKVESVYWYYPYINIGLGGLMFLLEAVKTPWS
jgi:4-hydroxybenzoate polyprenyltransferase